MNNFQRFAAVIAVAGIALSGVVGCAKDPKMEDMRDRSPAEVRAESLKVYKRARKELDNGDYSTAIKDYDQLLLRYPFTEYATQGSLELVYALYRSSDDVESTRVNVAADRFLREHPRHPAVDYVYYLKGLAAAEADRTMTTTVTGSVKGDVGGERRAFDQLALLIQKFPDSKYAGDARARMIYLRNRLADHELSVIDFYIRRGAYVAAAKRAEDLLAQYPGAPASYRALQMMELCYRRAGLTEQANDALRLLRAQPEAAQRGFDGRASSARGGFFGWFSNLFQDEAEIPEAELSAPPAPEAATPKPASAS